MLFALTAFSSGFDCKEYSLSDAKAGSSGDNKPRPDAPSDLTAVTISSNQINLSWKDNSKVEDGFKVERSVNGVLYALIATLNANITSYSDIDVIDGTIYYYRVCAYNKKKDSDYSNVASASITLNAPTSLTVTLISSTQINLSWTDNSGAESGYKIERKTGLSGIYSQIATVGVNVSSYPNAELTDGTTYYYRVRAYNANGDSGYSNDASTAISLNAPTNLITTTVTSSYINLSWSDNSNNEDGFKIERSSITNTNYTQIATVGSDILSYSDTTATEGNTYYYQIRAFNSNTNSTYSNETFVTIPLTAPSLRAVTVISSSQIDFSWIDNSNGELGFDIERSVITNTNYSLLATVGENIISYSDTGLTNNMTYYYRIRAYNTSENSTYSMETSATTINIIAWVEIKAGIFHSLGRKTNGTIYGWGYNQQGELGLGHSNTVYAPAQIGTNSDWTELAAGAYHTLARKTNGTIWVCGDDSYGCLGLGGVGDKLVPTQIGTDTDWAKIAAGRYTSFAIKSNGTLWGWGENSSNELGLGAGDTENRNTPSRIGNDNDWANIFTDGKAGIGIKINRTLWGWPHYFGSHVPAQMGIDTDWVQAACSYGLSYFFAIKANGSLWKADFQQIGTDTDWAKLGAGFPLHYACKFSGTLWSIDANTGVMSQIGSDEDWVEVVRGDYDQDHNIARKNNGTIWTWGSNLYGQLGLGDNISRSTPTMVGE